MHGTHNVKYTHSILCRAPGDEWLESFETCRADKKNCEIKIDYKNCVSRWSLTHYSEILHIFLFLSRMKEDRLHTDSLVVFREIIIVMKQTDVALDITLKLLLLKRVVVIVNKLR